MPESRKNRRSLIILCLLLLASPLLSSDEKPLILLLHSYHQGYKWTEDLTAGALSILRDRADVQIEYMDSMRYLGTPVMDAERYLELLSEILIVKHRRSSYDVIITADNFAFDYFREHGRKVFPDMPVVFCGINNIDRSIPVLDGNMTGVNEESDIPYSFRMIRDMFPERPNLLCITDRSNTGEILKGELEQEAVNFKGDFDSITILQDLSMEELEERLRALDDSFIVFYTFFFQDSQGNYFEYDKSTRRISEAAGDVPVVGAWDSSLGEGIIGGHLVSAFEQGRIAALKALEVIDKGSVRQVEINWNSPQSNAFDFEQLSRLQIPLNRLPRDHILINQPQSLFYTYRNESLAVLLFILMLLLMIIILINARLSLRKERDQLDLRVEERTRELTDAMKQLRMAQDKLIRQERQAAVGSLLAGMAHEINTPLGIALTGSSHLDRQLVTIRQHLEDETLTQEELEGGIEDFQDALQLTLRNLKRTAALVERFKSISLDSENQGPVNFKLKEYISELIQATALKYSEQGIRVLLQGEEIQMRSWPGYFYEILTHLMTNSLEHAFPEESEAERQDEKILTISLSEDTGNSGYALLEYRDNGEGFQDEIREVLFEPFISSRRQSGKTGLGMHRIYKTVTENLRGSIECPESTEKGVRLLIRFPKQTESV